MLIGYDGNAAQFLPAILSSSGYMPQQVFQFVSIGEVPPKFAPLVVELNDFYNVIAQELSSSANSAS
jgi:hypothetical protein